MARAISDLTYHTLQQEQEDEYADSIQPVRSLAAGVEGLKGSYNSTMGAVNRVIGRDQAAQEYEADAAANTARASGMRGAVPSFSDAKSLGDYGTWATDMIFSNVPLLTTMGAGRVAGMAAGGIRAAAGGLGKEAAAKAVETGATIGTATPYWGTTTGENYSRVLNDPDAEGSARAQALAAMGGGAAQTWLGMKPVDMLVGNLTKGAGAAKTIGYTALGEGVTEAGESAIGRGVHKLFNHNVNLLDSNAANEYIEAFLGGGLVGGVYSGIGYGVNKMLPERTQPTIDDRSGQPHQFDDTEPANNYEFLRRANGPDRTFYTGDTDGVPSVRSIVEPDPSLSPEDIIQQNTQRALHYVESAPEGLRGVLANDYLLNQDKDAPVSDLKASLSAHLHRYIKSLQEERADRENVIWYADIGDEAFTQIISEAADRIPDPNMRSVWVEEITDARRQELARRRNNEATVPTSLTHRLAILGLLSNLHARAAAGEPGLELRDIQETEKFLLGAERARDQFVGEWARAKATGDVEAQQRLETYMRAVDRVNENMVTAFRKKIQAEDAVYEQNRLNAQGFLEQLSARWNAPLSQGGLTGGEMLALEELRNNIPVMNPLDLQTAYRKLTGRKIREGSTDWIDWMTPIIQGHRFRPYRPSDRGAMEVDPNNPINALLGEDEETLDNLQSEAFGELSAGRLDTYYGNTDTPGAEGVDLPFFMGDVYPNAPAKFTNRVPMLAASLEQRQKEYGDDYLYDVVPWTDVLDLQYKDAPSDMTKDEFVADQVARVVEHSPSLYGALEQIFRQRSTQARAQAEAKKQLNTWAHELVPNLFEDTAAERDAKTVQRQQYVNENLQALQQAIAQRIANEQFTKQFQMIKQSPSDISPDRAKSRREDLGLTITEINQWVKQTGQEIFPETRKPNDGDVLNVVVTDEANRAAPAVTRSIDVVALGEMYLRKMRKAGIVDDGVDISVAKAFAALRGLAELANVRRTTMDFSEITKILELRNIRRSEQTPEQRAALAAIENTVVSRDQNGFPVLRLGDLYEITNNPDSLSTQARVAETIKRNYEERLAQQALDPVLTPQGLVKIVQGAFQPAEIAQQMRHSGMPIRERDVRQILKDVAPFVLESLQRNPFAQAVLERQGQQALAKFQTSLNVNDLVFEQTQAGAIERVRMRRAVVQAASELSADVSASVTWDAGKMPEDDMLWYRNMADKYEKIAASLRRADKKRLGSSVSELRKQYSQAIYKRMLDDLYQLPAGMTEKEISRFKNTLRLPDRYGEDIQREKSAARLTAHKALAAEFDAAEGITAPDGSDIKRAMNAHLQAIGQNEVPASMTSAMFEHALIYYLQGNQTFNGYTPPEGTRNPQQFVDLLVEHFEDAYQNAATSVLEKKARVVDVESLQDRIVRATSYEPGSEPETQGGDFDPEPTTLKVEEVRRDADLKQSQPHDRTPGEGVTELAQTEQDEPFNNSSKMRRVDKARAKTNVREPGTPPKIPYNTTGNPPKVGSEPVKDQRKQVNTAREKFANLKQLRFHLEQAYKEMTALKQRLARSAGKQTVQRSKDLKRQNTLEKDIRQTLQAIESARLDLARERQLRDLRSKERDLLKGDLKDVNSILGQIPKFWDLRTRLVGNRPDSVVPAVLKWISPADVGPQPQEVPARIAKTTLPSDAGTQNTESMFAPTSFKYATIDQVVQKWGTNVLNEILDKQTGGVHWSDGGVHFVWVHPRQNAAATKRALAHEIGHGIAEELAKNGVPDNVEAAYEAFKKRLGKSFDEARHSKAEWLADNIGLYLTTEPKVGDQIGSFFKAVAEALKALWKRILGQDQVDQAVKEWLDARWRMKQLEVVNNLTADDVAQGQTDATGRDGETTKPTEDVDNDTTSTDEFEEKLKDDAHVETVSRWAFQNGALTSDTILSIRQYLQKHLKKEEYGQLTNAAMSSLMQQRMRAALADNPELHESLRDPATAVAYLAALVHNGTVKPGPRSQDVLSTFFRGLARARAQISQTYTTEEAFEKLLRAMAENKLEGRNPDTSVSFIRPPKLFKNEVAQAIHDGLSAFIEGFYQNVWSPIMNNATERTFEGGKGTLTRVMRDIAAFNGFDQYTPGTLSEERRARTAEYMDEVNKIFKGRDDAFKAQLSAALYDRRVLKEASTEVNQVFTKLEKALKKVQDYNDEAMGRKPTAKLRTPQILDLQQISSDYEGLVKLLTDTLDTPALRQEWQKIHKLFREDFMRVNAHRGSEEEVKRLMVRELPKLGPDFVRRIVTDLVNGEGVSGAFHVGEARTLTPRFLSAGMLDFIRDNPAVAEETRTALSKYFHQDIEWVVFNHIKVATKQAEFAKRFGVGGERLLETLQKAKDEEGATAKDIRIVTDAINAVLGVHGIHTREALEAFLANAPNSVKDFFTKGQVQGKGFSAATGWLLTYQNFRLLPLSQITQLADVVGIGVRSNGFGGLLSAKSEAMEALWKNAKGDATHLGHLLNRLGYINAKYLEMSVINEMTSHKFTETQQKWNNAFFKYTGIEGLNTFWRATGTAMGERFILEHAKGENEHSQRYLEELGITKDDVAEDGNGGLKILTHEEFEKATDKERDRDRRLRIALDRFVMSAVPQPDAANRPTWQSDRNWALAAHMNQFQFAFTTHVLHRMWNEAFEYGNWAPLLVGVSGFIVMALFADWLKDLIKYGPEGPDYKRDWELTDHFTYALDRSDLWGKWAYSDKFIGHMFEGEFSKALAGSLGPTAEQIDYVTKYGFSQRELPLQVLWRHWGED